MSSKQHESYSLSGYVWRIKDTNERMANAISQRFELPDIIARILAGRGFDLDNLNDFLHPTLKQHLPNPFSLKDMEKSTSRVAEAI